MTRFIAGLLVSTVAVLAGQEGRANGFFNGPITSGDAVSASLAREGSLEDLIRGHDFCATETFKDVYRQIYPFNGELVVSLGQDRVPGPITFNPEPGYFFSVGGKRYLQGFFIIGPKDGQLDPELPRQLVFALNGDAFDRLIGGGRPDPRALGKLRIALFETNSTITLEAPYPAFEFDYERRTSGYDELGNEINPRYLVSNVRAVPGENRGTATPFRNYRTNQPTAVTLNSDALLECLASRTSTALVSE